MAGTIGVGIIGANPDRGWALDAHIPAIAASPEFELRAVATSRPASADAAARKFGVSGYTDAAALAADPAVDLVVVSVKVPHHATLVRAALAARKPIFCEWPLGNGLAESEALAHEAARAGVATFIGLQARASPGYNHVRRLLRDNHLGEVLATSVLASSPLPGSTVAPENSYTLDRANGASMLTIPFGHTTDAIFWCLGEPERLVAEMATRRPNAIERGTGRVLPVTIADQIAVAGRLASGVTLSIHYRGGLSAATGFLWEIIGTEGVLSVTAAHGVTEMIELTVSGARANAPPARIETPAECLWAPEGTPGGSPFNVAQAYALIARDLRDGGRRWPNFADAVHRHRLLDRIERLSENGRASVEL